MSDRFIKSLRIVTYGIRDGRSINTEEFMKLEVHIPDIAIQISIIDFLNKLDIKITSEQKCMEMYDDQKKYLINKMII